MVDENGAVTAYVVQYAEVVDFEPDDVKSVWIDLPAIHVAPRTKRSTVIREALKAAGMEPPEGGRLEVRVLNPDAAEPTIVLPSAAATGPRELRL